MNSQESPVTIANAALGKVGVALISSLFPPDPTSKGAQRVASCYYQLLDYCLAQAPFTFAKKTVALNRIPTTSLWVTGKYYSAGHNANYGGNTYLCLKDNLAGVFATDLANGYWVLTAPVTLIIPHFGDGVRVAYAYPDDWIKPNKWNYPQAIIRLEDNIYSDTRGLKVKYTWRNLDPTTYSPEFIEAFATKIAGETAYDLTNNIQLKQMLLKEYDDKMGIAISADAQNETPDQAQQSEWFIARLAGSQTAVPLVGEVGFFGTGTP